MTPEAIAAWAKHAVDSPLYVRLSGVIADDTELVRVLDGVANLPQLNILLAAVHMILARGTDDPLASYYASLTDDPRPIDDDLAGHFRRFVLDHEAEVATIGARRYTQTNEARRCVALLPAVWMSGLDRFHLVEIGASAGLNLALDRYRYRWGDVEWGTSPLLLEAGSRGADPQPRPVAVGRRIGLDVNPLDPRDPDDRAWLEALLWPEDPDRRSRLRAALDITAGLDIEMVAGDASITLPEVLDTLPAGEPVVVMDSFTLNQLTPEQRSALEEAVADARRDRDVFRISLGQRWRDDGSSLDIDDGTGWRQVAEAHHHGRWVDFYVLP